MWCIIHISLLLLNKQIDNNYNNFNYFKHPQISQDKFVPTCWNSSPLRLPYLTDAWNATILNHRGFNSFYWGFYLLMILALWLRTTKLLFNHIKWQYNYAIVQNYLNKSLCILREKLLIVAINNNYDERMTTKNKNN